VEKHNCCSKGCRNGSDLTIEHRFPDSEPAHVCVCKGHAEETLGVIREVLPGVMNGEIESIRLYAHRRLAEERAMTPTGLAIEPAAEKSREKELEQAKRGGLTAFLKVVEDLKHMKDDHTSEALMEFGATLVGAIFREVYLSLDEPRKLRWARISGIGLARALAHGRVDHEDRLEVAREILQASSEMKTYRPHETVDR